MYDDDNNNYDDGKKRDSKGIWKIDQRKIQTSIGVKFSQ